MADNYDSVCSLCGQEVKDGALYYCCPDCYRLHRKNQNGENAVEPNSTEEQLLNKIVESEQKQV